MATGEHQTEAGMSGQWMRVNEAAAALSVSESTVRRRVSEGRLRGRIGKSGRQEVMIKDAATPSTNEAETPSIARAEQEDLLRRYERLAGGSLVLAQQRADELNKAASAAYENLAHARSQMRQLRKFALAGWATCAAVLIAGFALTMGLGVSGAKAQARADAHEQASRDASERVERLRHKLAEVRDAEPNHETARALAGVE